LYKGTSFSKDAGGVGEVFAFGMLDDEEITVKPVETGLI
jgi:hypothetical protein